MLKNKIKLLAILLLIACTNTEADQLEVQEQPRTTQSVNQVCSQPELVAASQAFLSALRAGDIAKAKSFYYPSSIADGDGYGVNYTFFPKNDDMALFNFGNENAQDEFGVEVFGAYEDGRDTGQLVLFVQEQYKNKISDENFLVEKKFDGYFACYFQCKNDNWMITKYACFEDSGGPFYPSDSDYP